MKRLLSFVLVLLATLGVAGCESSSTGPFGTQSVPGTWYMTSLGNQGLPAPLFYNSAQDHVEILDARITFYDDGTYVDVTRVQDTYYGPTTVTDDRTNGYWELSGSRLTLTDYSGNVTVGYIDGNRRFVVDSFAGYGVRAIYER